MRYCHNERKELSSDRYEKPSNAVHIDAVSFSVRILNTRNVNTSTQSCTICVTKYEPHKNRIKSKQKATRTPEILSRENWRFFSYTSGYGILYYDQQMHTIISQIITLLHVSTLSGHPQTACNQYLAKLHKYFKCRCWQYSLQLRCFTQVYLCNLGARGGAVVWYTALQAGRSRVRFPVVSLEFFWHNPSGRTMALGLTQPLTEMSTRNIFWG